MRNLKKIISLALALMMVLSMMVTASAAFADADQIDAVVGSVSGTVTGIADLICVVG